MCKTFFHWFLNLFLLRLWSKMKFRVCLFALKVFGKWFFFPQKCGPHAVFLWKTCLFHKKAEGKIYYQSSFFCVKFPPPWEETSYKFCWEYEEYMWIFELNYGEIRWSNQLNDGWSVFSFHWGWTWYIHMFNSDFEWMRDSSLKIA